MEEQQFLVDSKDAVILGESAPKKLLPITFETETEPIPNSEQNTEDGLPLHREVVRYTIHHMGGDTTCGTWDKAPEHIKRDYQRHYDDHYFFHVCFLQKLLFRVFTQ